MADIDFEEEVETRDELNMMNNSLLQVYAEECPVPALDLTSDPAGVSDSQACSHDDALQSATVPCPMNASEGVCSDELLSHVSTTDSHVIAGVSHVTTGDTHMTASDSVVPALSSTIATDMTVCSGGSVSVGRGEEVERGGADTEERRRLKKVTFAPDVVDKQPKAPLKVRVNSIRDFQ